MITKCSTAFNIKLGDLLIGTLTYNNNTWYFKYSDEFKSQDKFTTLVTFPSKHKEYSTITLWPFFTSRIPGKYQLQQCKYYNKDIIELLCKFGERTINNPYKLLKQTS